MVFLFVASNLRRYSKNKCLLDCFSAFRLYSSTRVNWAKRDSLEMPKNILEEHITAHNQQKVGVVYDKKPFKMLIKANKQYYWCSCGWSKNQPLCDGSHKNPYIKIELRPVSFMVAEEKEYYLCNCKQTTHRPFCDGTHKRDDIQQQPVIKV